MRRPQDCPVERSYDISASRKYHTRTPLRGAAGVRASAQLPRLYGGEGRVLMEPRLPAGLEFGLEAFGVELRVLFIDSSGYSAGLFKDYVGQSGMEIDLARNPRQALRRLKKHFYDVVVIELPTPQIPPDDLFRDIVAIDLEQAVRVIFMVNDLGESSTRKFLTDAGRPFLTQPVDPAELHDLVLRVGLQERAD